MCWFQISRKEPWKFAISVCVRHNNLSLQTKNSPQFLGHRNTLLQVKISSFHFWNIVDSFFGVISMFMSRDITLIRCRTTFEWRFEQSRCILFRDHVGRFIHFSDTRFTDFAKIMGIDVAEISVVRRKTTFIFSYRRQSEIIAVRKKELK